MLRTSRTLVAALVVLFALGAALPASAQTARGSKARVTRGASSAKVKRASPARSRTRTSTARTVKPRSIPSNARRTVRVNRAPAANPSKSRIRSTFTTGKTGSQRKVTVRDLPRKNQERVARLFRKRPDRRIGDDGRGRRDPYRRGYDGHRGYESGYRHGYSSGYRHGYHEGSYYGFCYGRCYRHHRYYGSRLIFGWHYGGFGFYDGYWHFAIVIGGPVLVHRHYYNYTWWDGSYSSLYTWDRAMEVHPANYTFDYTKTSCVELLLNTTDGTEYEIKVDPRYWNARDPGDLYAALWSELEREGQLQIQDVNGAVHVFPAGMIQQIEARPCN